MAITSEVERIIDIQELYIEPEVYQYQRGKEILAKYAGAKITEVSSHWNIPELHGNKGSIEGWLRIKKNILILGIKKSLICRPNERSSNFVAPSISNGCAMACSYCYVPRRKGFANPITRFVNIERICSYLQKHALRQGVKHLPDQTDPHSWVYDIGENGDCSLDAAICDNVKDYVNLFKAMPNAKASFATKFVNRQLLEYDPQGKTRIRFSLMPMSVAKVVDIRTSPVAERIGAINDFVQAGYEVHLNFSPVIYYENWLQDYTELFQQIDDVLDAKAKAQLKCEIIFLTHNSHLHDINMGWHPRGEDLLWAPDLQETKFSQTGGKNLRYKKGFKSDLALSFQQLLKKSLPYCNRRYAF